MEFIAISKVIPNSDNPRYIKEEKFKKLVQSLKDFPEMANVRPIVVNKEMVALGGNMRLKAMQEAGWSEGTRSRLLIGQKRSKGSSSLRTT
jgi:ParB-like chromosome segregation protein Spo0J